MLKFWNRFILCKEPILIKPFNVQLYPVPKHSLFTNYREQQTLRTFSTKVLSMAQFNEPRKLISQVNNFKDKLWEVFPEPVKEFPLKKAEDMVLQRLQILGKTSLKWSLVILFIVSFLSDFTLSISRNKELIVPFGLFFGCTMGDFLKEVSHDLLSFSKGEELRWRLWGIGLFFVFIKVVAVYLSLGRRVFLSHVGTGGLMHVLWMLNKMQEGKENGEIENSFVQN
ncbi:hypothetical protein ACHQM5_025286 [Ranunculus cassubicifolius]